jgi:hypothetical protein
MVYDSAAVFSSCNVTLGSAAERGGRERERIYYWACTSDGDHGDIFEHSILKSGSRYSLRRRFTLTVSLATEKLAGVEKPSSRNRNGRKQRTAAPPVVEEVRRYKL